MTPKKPRVTPSASKQKAKRGKGRPSIEEGHVDGKEILIEKTCELLSKLPPKDVTRSAVAKAANVDPSLIRYYFKTHSQLLVAGFERATGEYNRILERESARFENTPEGQLRGRISALFQLNKIYPYYHRLLIEEIAPGKTAAARKSFADLTKNRKGAYSDLLKRGVEEGIFKETDPGLTFISIISMCHFFHASPEVVAMVTGRSTEDPKLADEYQEMVVDMIFNGIRKHS